MKINKKYFSIPILLTAAFILHGNRFLLGKTKSLSLNLKEVSALEFTPGVSEKIPGKGKGKPAEALGRVGIALSYKQRNYWTDDRYSAKEYHVTKGEIVDPGGRLPRLEAYEISKPVFAANHKFPASGNELFYKFPAREDFVVYSFRALSDGTVKKKRKIIFKNGMLVEEAIIPGSKIEPDTFIKIEGILLSGLRKKTLFIFLPKKTVLSPYTKINQYAGAALFARTSIGTAGKYIFNISRFGRTVDSYSGFSYGPASHRLIYGKNSDFRMFDNGDGSIGVAWQDQSGNRISVTTINADANVSSIQMPYASGTLAGITRSSDNYYYITVGNSNNPGISFMKTDIRGKVLKKRTLSNSKMKFNVYNFGGNVMSLLYADDRIGMVMGRTMQKSSDGLNHQGSIAAVFNAKDLATVKNFGQNSGHSFDSRIIHDGHSFVTIDLGDNYPRGIIIHKISDTGKAGRVIYTYKTAHGKRPSPYRRGLAAGKWSNDNRTYTELGAVLPGERGYMVLFSSEKSHENTRANGTLNESRNIGMVLVNKDFEKHPQKSRIVTDKIVISKGESTPEFGYYSFDGKYYPQKNVGVIWLTNYLDLRKENASRIKAASLGEGKYIALWEKWTENSYVSTHALLFNEAGDKLSSIVDLGNTMRLHPGDIVLAKDKRIYWVTGTGGTLELNIFEIN